MNTTPQFMTGTNLSCTLQPSGTACNALHRYHTGTAFVVAYAAAASVDVTSLEQTWCSRVIGDRHEPTAQSLARTGRRSRSSKQPDRRVLDVLMR